MSMQIGRDQPFSYGPIPTAKPPSAPQDEYEKVNEDVCKLVVKEKTEAATGTSGGHGGFRVAMVKVKGEEHHVFLKKYDPVEHKNYQVIQRDGSLRDFMARCYGKVEIGGQEYLVLQNLSIGQTQVADVKLSKVGEDKIGIQSDAEMLATRGRTKSELTKRRMDREAKKSPGIMIAASGPKFMRTFKYSDSLNLLAKMLFQPKPEASEGLTKKPTPEQLTKFDQQLDQLQIRLGKSPGGFIGTSLLIYRNNQSGDFNGYLGDFAHAVFDEAKTNDNEGLYRADKEKVKQRQKANQDSVGVIQFEIRKEISKDVAAEKLSKTDPTPKTSPSTRRISSGEKPPPGKKLPPIPKPEKTGWEDNPLYSRDSQ